MLATTHLLLLKLDDGVVEVTVHVTTIDGYRSVVDA